MSTVNAADAAVAMTAQALEGITAHASAAYPEECCGALIEVDGTIVDALPLANVTHDEAARRYLVSPADYRAAERRARELGGELAGFYHSHPDHPARPSPTDLEHAWPNWSYVIMSVMGGVPGAVTCWRLRDDRSSFEQKDLQWQPRS